MVHLTPAAIHKQLKQLEDELCTPLYEKGAHGLELTAAAELILPFLHDILSQRESALSALQEWHGMRRGLVRIGAGPSLASYLLPPLLRSYHDRFPGIDLDVQTGTSVQLLSSVEDGQLDMALVASAGGGEAEKIQLHLERQVELFVVTCLAEVPSRISVRSVAKWPMLLFRRGSRIEALMTSYWDAHRVEPNSIMRFDSAEAMKTTLLSGVGMAMMPAYTVERELREGSLRRIRLREPAPTMNIRVVSRKSGFVPPAARAFIEMAQAVLPFPKR